MCGKNETKIKRKDAVLIASELSRYMSIGENKWLLKFFRTRRKSERERERGSETINFPASSFQSKRCHMCSKDFNARQKIS
jgi:hypothetical protein